MSDGRICIPDLEGAAPAARRRIPPDMCAGPAPEQQKTAGPPAAEGLCDTFTLQLFPGPVNGKTHILAITDKMVTEPP